MALVTRPSDVLPALSRVSRRVLRRLLPVDEVARDELRKVPDDLPRDTLFAQPLVVDTRVHGEPEPMGDDERRVTFRVLVRDADGRRCPDVHVEARVTGPTRSAVGEATTDMLGAARFRMSGPPGDYRIDVIEVAALALRWDRAESTATASITTV